MSNSETDENDPVRTFVQNALQAKEHGNSFQYDVVVQQMRRREDPETICRVVVVMENFSSYLSIRSDLFQDLLHAIFSYDWKGEDRMNMAMMDLIIAIISCNVTFAKLAYRGFVHTFFQPDLAQKEHEEDEEVRRKRFDCIHDGVRAISSQVPMSTTNLFEELRANFPHKRFAHRVQAEYLHHCLRICDAIPRIRDKLLDLIVTKCLEIDVEIVIEDSGEAHVEQETASGVDTTGNTTAQTTDSQKHVDERLTSPESNGDDLSSLHFFSALQVEHDNRVHNTKNNSKLCATVQKIPILPIEENKAQQALQESADKLDAMLSRIIEYIAAQSPNAKSSTVRSTSHYLEFWPILLKIFEKRLLVTPKAKFVQFIFFYATTALQPKIFAESFCRRLLVVAFDLSAPIAVRLSATMYLASFVARANVLSLPLVRDIVREMLEWCVMYVLVYRADPHYPQPVNTQAMDLDDPSADLDNNSKFHADPVNGLTTLVKRRLKKKFATLREHAKAELAMAQQYQQQQWQRQQQQQKHQRGTLSTSSSYSRLSDAASQMSGLSSLSPHNNFASPNNSSTNNNQTVMELDEYGRLQVKESSIRQHIVFYAMAQAMAYILCFYGTDLIDSFSPVPASQSRKMSEASDQHSHPTRSRKRKHSEDESELLFATNVDESGLDESSEEREKHVTLSNGLEIVFGSRFEPLRYVMTSIRYEFFRLAIHKQLFPPAMWLCHLSPDYMNFENDLVDVTALTTHSKDQDNEYRKRQEDERNKIINNSILQYYYNLQRSLEEENENERDGSRQLKKSLKDSDDDDENYDVRSVVSGLSYSSRMSLFSSASMYSRSSVSTVAYAQSVWSAPSYEENGYHHNYAHNEAGPGSQNHNNSSMYFYQQQQYQELMENFFPFDPCLLRALHDKVATYYREWEGVPGLPLVPAMRSRNNSEILGDSVVLEFTEDDEDEGNEDVKCREEEESEIEEDDDGRLLGEDEDIVSDALPEEEDEEEAVIASGAIRILKTKPKPPLISSMDPTHPLLSGGFFLLAQNADERTSANTIKEIDAVVQNPQASSQLEEKKENGECENEYTKKKKRKDKKDKKRRSSVEMTPLHVDEVEDVNDTSMAADDVHEERGGDMEDAEEEKLRKKKEKKEKKKKEKKEKHRSLLAAEKTTDMDVLDKVDEDGDHYHASYLTSSALQQHVLNSHQKTKHSVEKQQQSHNTMHHIHSNPVVDRFLREQQQQQQIASLVRKKGKSHTDSVPSSIQKNDALHYITPHKDIYVQQKTSASGSRVIYDDLPQPEFSPMQQQQMFDYRGNFVRQMSELPHSNTKHTPHSQYDDDFEQDYGANHQLLYEENLVMHHQVGGGTGSTGGGGDEDNMGRSSRPRQYSITSTGSW